MRSARYIFFRIFYNSTYSFLSLVLFVLLSVTPIEIIYQIVRQDQLENIFILAGVYLLTALLTLFIYASRLYTNRSVLTAIPKAWVPVEEGEVGKRVRKIIVRNLERSLLVAWDSRPRDARHELGREEIEVSSAMNGQKHSLGFYRKSQPPQTVVPIDPAHPPWGIIEHRGWSSPTSDDLPNLFFASVVPELPNLIEAKAVSLTSMDGSIEGTDGSLDTAARATKLLQRPAAMGVRDYLDHLAALEVINSPAVVAEFSTQYEHARFSTLPLTEGQFRDLIAAFAAVLTSMNEVHPRVLFSLGLAEDKAEVVSLAPSTRSTSTNGSQIHHRSLALSSRAPSTAFFSAAPYLASTANQTAPSLHSGTRGSNTREVGEENMEPPGTIRKNSRNRKLSISASSSQSSLSVAGPQDRQSQDHLSRGTIFDAG